MEFIVLHSRNDQSREVLINKNHILKVSTYLRHEGGEESDKKIESSYIQLTVPIEKTYSSSEPAYSLFYPEESYEQIREMLLPSR